MESSARKKILLSKISNDNLFFPPKLIFQRKYDHNELEI